MLGVFWIRVYNSGRLYVTRRPSGDVSPVEFGELSRHDVGCGRCDGGRRLRRHLGAGAAAFTRRRVRRRRGRQLYRRHDSSRPPPRSLFTRSLYAAAADDRFSRAEFRSIRRTLRDNCSNASRETLPRQRCRHSIGEISRPNLALSFRRALRD